VRVLLKRTVVSVSHFDNPSGLKLSSRLSEYCLSVDEVFICFIC